ncbi:hypothetical protein RF11_02656 [Thelohanellus kitauei]|uniref:Integrase zinc-binding domain-containing protein n=1 Tax=Thelohanellus kitauei TaxID=669202 RepID=A0A0C2J8R0_THEKT|nr:hypothetical protein RF11_02656 [Thelohanellus kitauei]
MAKGQQPESYEYSRLKIDTELQLKSIMLPDSDPSFIYDLSLGYPRQWVPNTWRKHAFDTLDNLSDRSIGATKKLLDSKLIWIGIKREFSNFSRCNLKCQKKPIFSVITKQSSKNSKNRAWFKPYI